jgi:hypothetical protein
MHQFNALQSDSGRTKSFEAEHRSNNALDGPMALLDEIVQIFALTNFDGLTGSFLERLLVATNNEHIAYRNRCLFH